MDSLTEINYNIVAEMTNQCPTSNCTWPDYTSLAVCACCESVVPDAVCRGANVSVGVENCTYTFPDKQTIDACASLDPGPAELEPQQQTLPNITAPADLDKPSESIGKTYAISFQDLSQDWHLQAPVADVCELKWCQHTFSQLGVEAGVLTDVPTST